MLTIATRAQSKRKVCYCHILGHYVRVGRCAKREGHKHDYCREMQARSLMRREMQDVQKPTNITRVAPRTAVYGPKPVRVNRIAKSTGDVDKRRNWTVYRSMAEHDRAYGVSQ